MFVTTHDMAIPVPVTLQESETEYWGAFKLSNEAPWFLVTLSMSDGSAEHAQTVGVAWESTLRSLVESCPSDAILGIRRLSASDRGAGNWEMEDVSELWRPAPAEEESAGPLLIKIAAEEGLRNARHSKVASNVPGRELLVRVGGLRRTN